VDISFKTFRDNVIIYVPYKYYIVKFFT